MGRKALLISLLLLSSLLFPRSASVAMSVDLVRGTQPRVVSPSPRPIRVRFEGIVTAISPIPDSVDELWTIADVDIMVTASTQILPEGYQITVGDLAKVEALHANDQLVALEIEAVVGPIEARVVEFQGIIDSLQTGEGQTELIIAGTRVLVNETTQVLGELAVGYLAQVRGELRADGSVVAAKIDTTSPNMAANNVEFEDEIAEIQENWWYLGDQQQPNEWVRVWTTSAEIPNQGHVGLTAQVRGFRQQDGSVLADLILVEEISSSDEERLSGLVVSQSPAQWVIEQAAGGQVTVYLDLNSFVDESRAPALPGNIAQVTALERQDGTFLALRIRMERPD